MNLFKSFLCGLIAFLFMFSLSFVAPITSAQAADEEVEEVEVDSYAYVTLRPIVVPILNNKGDAQIVTILLSLEVPNSSAETKVQEQKIRLVDAFITDMYGVLDNNRLLRNGYIDVAQMKKRLGKISDKVLGIDTVSEVLVKGVQQRPV